MDSVTKMIKAAKKSKGTKAAPKNGDDFDFDVDTAAETSPEAKKAQRAKRRASKGEVADAKPAKGSKKAPKAKAEKPAKAAKPAKAEKPGRNKKAAKPAKAEKTSRRSAKADKSAKPGAVAYKGDLASLISQGDLEKPGRLQPNDVGSVYNNFVFSLNKEARRAVTVNGIAKALVEGTTDAFGIKVPATLFASAASDIRDKVLATFAKAAKKKAAELKALAKSEDGASSSDIDDAVDAIINAE